MLHGQGVSEMDSKSKATAEIRSLTNEIIEFVPVEKTKKGGI
jgi:Flp pilus assembly CpaE family ATPase